MKCGFVALVGAPNSGKSTLINALVGDYVSIVTHKRHTTRKSILGIVCSEESQIVFVDTPGIGAPKNTFESRIEKSAYRAFRESDLVVLMIDCSKYSIENDLSILKKVPDDSIVVLNKIDRINKADLLPLVEKIYATKNSVEILMLSALKKTGIEHFIEVIKTKIPEGNWMFDEDEKTTLSLKDQASEITREMILHNFHEEVPYRIFVQTEKIEYKNKSYKIYQNLIVERSSQKIMIIGKNGESIRNIGYKSRTKLEEIWNKQVHLFLNVKIQSEWTNDKKYINMISAE
jgi:GTPase